MFYQAEHIDLSFQKKALRILVEQKDAVLKSLRDCLEVSSLAEPLPKSHVRPAYWLGVSWCLMGSEHQLTVDYEVNQEDYWETTTFDVLVVVQRQGFPLSYAVLNEKKKSKVVTKIMRSLVKSSGYGVSPFPSWESGWARDEGDELDKVSLHGGFDMPRYSETRTWTQEDLESWLLLCFLTLWTDAAIENLLEKAGVSFSLEEIKAALTQAKLVCLEGAASESLYAKIATHGDFESIAKTLGLETLPRIATKAQLSELLKLGDD